MTEYLTNGCREKCCGCGACAEICPVGAIRLLPDDEGFAYPQINKELCIECGRCGQVCPYNGEADGKEPLKTYAFVNKNYAELLSSSSGGAFIAFANAVLREGGFVCGCIFDEDLRAVHILSSEIADVKKMQGSKYVQSELGGVYGEIKEKLRAGKRVLFSGTPCQVDGLKKYLGRDYPELYTLDLICHGVPSPRLLADFIAAEEGDGKKITDLKFRDKRRNGWCSQGSITYLKNGKSKTKTISPFNSSYYYYYLRNAVSRPCCYTCGYSSTSRVGDITIGDYWNIAEVAPTVNTDGGVSAVLVNTEKGRQLTEKISAFASLTETSLEAAVAGNGNLSAPCERPQSRDRLYAKINERGYTVVAAEECRYSRVMPFIKKHIPRGVKKALKKILK